MSDSIITLSTDFGTRDGFVGIMKGVILSIAPDARIVDVGHWIRPQDILEGQFLLMRAVPYFPKRTIHVAVVDPDVGTSRRPIVVETSEALFVGPDNGLFTPWLNGANVYHLNREKYHLENPSATFHGRDIFSPVAAHLASGTSPAELGDPIKDPVIMEIPKPKIKGGTIRGEVIHIDYFGNLITNIPASALAPFLPQGTVRPASAQPQKRVAHSHSTLVWAPQAQVHKVKPRAGREAKSPAEPVIGIAQKKIYGLVRTYGSEPAIKTHVLHRDPEGSGQPDRPMPLVALIGSHGNLEIAVPMGNAQKILNAKRGDTVTVREK